MAPYLSIIVPVYNEEASIPLLIAALQESVDPLDLAYEIIFVDDGSQDQTYPLIKEAAIQDSRIRGLRFRRNNGQTAAIQAGLEHAQGEISITLDGDLQHDPRQIPAFIHKIEEGYDLICSYRRNRNDAFLRRFPSKVANFLARKFSGLEIRDFGSTFRAYRTSLAHEIEVYGEMHRFIPVFFHMRSDRITELPIQLNPRKFGSSKYGLGRTFRVISDLISLLFYSGFFNRPTHMFGYIALTLGIPGFGILSWLSIEKLLGRIQILDYGPLFVLGVLLCLVAGQMVTTGIVCEYLLRIYYSGNHHRPYSLAETTPHWMKK
ncbi:MAG: glycosyltransferase family 2 protein [Desulfohalobiaceae bacterium]|nr:glycosyltransferase family 2 protein [Desulfohalobiaceae bacterium]